MIVRAIYMANYVTHEAHEFTIRQRVTLSCKFFCPLLYMVGVLDLKAPDSLVFLFPAACLKSHRI